VWVFTFLCFEGVRSVLPFVLVFWVAGFVVG